jgi:AraC family transcriptional regulator
MRVHQVHFDPRNSRSREVYRHGSSLGSAIKKLTWKKQLSRKTAKMIKHGVPSSGTTAPEQTAKMKNSTLQFYKERLLRVLIQIQQRLDEPLSLEELARQACLSPFHFHRVFRGMIGESLKSHIRRLRLERAASRLKLSGRPVIEIAFDAGYETHEAFTRAFHSAFGRSPSNYRRLRQAALELKSPSGVHYAETLNLKNFHAIRMGNIAMKVTIKNIESFRVAFMRQVGPYSECSATWEKFGTYLGKEGRLGPGTQFIGISHDDPEVTPPDKIRYDACVTVTADFQPEGEIGVQMIPGGEYAMMTHFGSYDRFNETYAQLLGQWLPRSGRELRASPCFEVYLNSPENTAPEDLLTDIYAPLQPQ